MSLSDVVVRFVVMAGDGRRSEVWRVWTGNKQPTDEVYVALRSEAGSGLKVSIHGDGYRQHGPTVPLRGQLRVGDGYALDRWRRQDVPQVSSGVSFDYFVEFPTDDLTHPAESTDLADVVTIGAADPGRAICVAVLVAEPGSEVAELTASCFASLERKSGGGVYMLALQVPYRPIVVPHERRCVWQMTPHGGQVSERFVFFTGPSADWPRGAIDMAVDRHPEMHVAPHVPDFRGRLLPWHELPVAFTYDGHLCGLLRCAPGESASLFVDTASRCSITQLTRDANDPIDLWEQGDIDSGWDLHSDGSWITGLRGQGHGGYPSQGNVPGRGIGPEA